MSAKHLTAAAAITLGLGLTGVGAGVGTASANPGHNPSPCGSPYCQGGPQRGDGENGGRGGPPSDQQRWDQRDLDRGRYDHQPFNYHGQRVQPYFDNDRGAWGFWSLGQWIGL